MATIEQHEWTATELDARGRPRRVRRSAFGYNLRVNGRRERKWNGAWTTEALARAALTAREQQIAAEVIETQERRTMTFGEAVDRYLEVKAKKRSLRDDGYHLTHLRAAFGADTPLAGITAARISDYKVQRMKATVRRAVADRVISPGTLNRELAALRHLLRLAPEEWEVLARVPRLKLEREPEGRMRWLEGDEEARLLAACGKAQSRDLVAIVTVATETGMRYSEIMNMEWELIDLTRGVIRLERTKSGKRREVPTRQVVYDLLAGRAGEWPGVGLPAHPPGVRERRGRGQA